MTFPLNIDTERLDALMSTLSPLQLAREAAETLCSVGARVRNMHIAWPAPPAIWLEHPGNLRAWLDQRQCEYSECDGYVGRAVYCARVRGCDVIWWEDA
jgi:hypothetical protein